MQTPRNPLLHSYEAMLTNWSYRGATEMDVPISFSTTLQASKFRNLSLSNTPSHHSAYIDNDIRPVLET